MKCDFCGREYRLDVLEYYFQTREFELDACCQWAYEDAVQRLNEGVERKDFRRWFADRTGQHVRQTYADDGQFLLDFDLTVVEVTQKEAKAFIAEHHQHNDPPPGWYWGHGLANGSDLVAVAWVGQPVSRVLMQRGQAEINRCCTDAFCHRALVWNACSILYKLAGDRARAEGYPKIITYTLITEAASALRALKDLGWKIEATTKGGSWNCPSRPREDKHNTGKKYRWGLDLTKQEAA